MNILYNELTHKEINQDEECAEDHDLKHGEHLERYVTGNHCLAVRINGDDLESFVFVEHTERALKAVLSDGFSVLFHLFAYVDAFLKHLFVFDLGKVLCHCRYDGNGLTTIIRTVADDVPFAVGNNEESVLTNVAIFNYLGHGSSHCLIIGFFVVADLDKATSCK